MTEDTKKALEIIQPLAGILGIDVEADKRFLYMDGQAIGISCNSTHATVMEMIGWIFAERYLKGFRLIKIPDEEMEDGIKRYWISKEKMEKIS